MRWLGDKAVAEHDSSVDIRNNWKVIRCLLDEKHEKGRIKIIIIRQLEALHIFQDGTRMQEDY